MRLAHCLGASVIIHGIAVIVGDILRFESVPLIAAEPIFEVSLLQTTREDPRAPMTKDAPTAKPTTNGKGHTRRLRTNTRRTTRRNMRRSQPLLEFGSSSPPKHNELPIGSLRDFRVGFEVLAGEDESVPNTAMATDRAASRQAMQVDRYRLKRSAIGGWMYRDTTFNAEITPDGTLRFVDRANVHVLRPERIEFKAGFDLTDAVMRALGQDPYGYEKNRFAQITQPLRTKMRQRYHKRLRKQALAELSTRLITLSTELHGVRLRRVLFELWDDVDEIFSSSAATTPACTQAHRYRTMIVAFIAHNLPANTPKGYSAAELHKLNRIRKSSVAFAPYSQNPARGERYQL